MATKLKFLFIYLLLCFSSCEYTKKSVDDTSDHTSNIAIVLQLDTLNGIQRNSSSDSLLFQLRSSADTLTPTYFYFKGYQYTLQGENDSAAMYYQKIDSLPPSEWAVLRFYHLANNAVSSTSSISSETFDNIYDGLKNAEQINSVFIYGYYDLLAKAYFLNRNSGKAKEFTDLYYLHHPFKNNTTVQQRYYDISFLLSERLGDKELMQNYLDSSRTLALHIHDSTALMRTYEFEAQLRRMQGRFGEAIEAQKKHFDYLQNENTLNVYAFNNLANLYLKSRQYEPALSYYKQGIDGAAQHSPQSDLMNFYGGLREAYAAKGDYKNAYVALDSVLQQHYRNAQKMQEQKISELHIQYETEKKETAIQNLQASNIAHQKIIAQQKWILAVSALLFVLVVLFLYNNYQRRILSEKNKQLEADNKKLQLEQKLRQMQLNPHFMYNAIANLQGLIGREKKEAANAYLLSFSRLIRNILELNRKDFISLDDEIASLENYMKLQQIRYEDTFDYRIDTGSLDTFSIGLPPMLLQPFVENAIEHGFKNIDYPGKLHIRFETKDEQLQITITDNGRAKPNTSPNTKQSLSSVIIQERLDILYNREVEQARFVSRNLADEGKNGYEVNLYIPLEYLN